jgi:hypothetical protein
MPSLIRRKPTDAQGKPIDPVELYEPISSHARGHRVYNQGTTVLRGSDPDVLAASHLWIRTNATTPEKGQARAEHVARRRADFETGPDPQATIILRPIPPERRMRAVREYHDRAGRIIQVGDLADSNDPFVKANRELFAPDPQAAL